MKKESTEYRRIFSKNNQRTIGEGHKKLQKELKNAVGLIHKYQMTEKMKTSSSFPHLPNHSHKFPIKKTLVQTEKNENFSKIV